MNCVEGGELAIGESLFSELEAWPAAGWTIFFSLSQAHLARVLRYSMRLVHILVRSTGDIMTSDYL